ncbi:MAG: acetolactate synthase [Deltaproteobacteria bacterium]|nr:acetolactate synthase [Deltaproteobacteria bacterium]
MDGGTQVAQVLAAQGVEQIFTLCGGHISPILVESKKLGIRIIDTRHEVNAVFAADATGRVTGVPGVAAVTAGPGVSNTITAVKNAQLAQSPLVVIGGATATMLRGRGSLQDIDQLAMIRPHVKWSARPNTQREVIPALEEAFRQAKRGVPGPVFVELAVDLLYDESIVRSWYAVKTEIEDPNLIEKITAGYIRWHLDRLFSKPYPAISAPPSRSAPEAPGGLVGRAAKLLDGAKRPVLVIGSQVMLHPDRAQELVDAVTRLGIPTYLSGMARGLLGVAHPLQFRHKRRNALKGSDLVILAGVPADFRLDYGAHVNRTTVIGVNLSKEDLTKNRRPDLAALTDPHGFLVALSNASGGSVARDAWFETLRGRESAREQEILQMGEVEVDHLNPLRFCQALERHLTADSVLIGDGGDFVATASYIVSPPTPYSWLDPGVFGTLGVGAGFAMGVQAARPDALVWLLYGDGAAGMSLMEMDTFARHGLPVIAVVGNDAGWTQITRDQAEILGDDVATVLTYMDYHTVAEGCGCHGIRVDREDQMDAALAEAVEVARGGKPVLINAILGKSDFRKGSLSM